MSLLSPREPIPVNATEDGDFEQQTTHIENGQASLDITKSIAKLAISEFHFNFEHGQEQTHITHRQGEILELLALGMTNRKIGKRLGISSQTVNRHVDDLLCELEAKNRTHAVALAIRSGILVNNSNIQEVATPLPQPSERVEIASQNVVVEIGKAAVFTALVDEHEENVIILPQREQAREDEPAIDFTPKEKQMLAYLAQGLTTQEIQKKDWVTRSTVQFHLNSIYKKLGAKRSLGIDARILATSYALSHGHGTIEKLMSEVADKADIPISPAEARVLELLAEGLTNSEIASRQWVTEQTVKFHLSSIYRSWNIDTRSEAARIYILIKASDAKLKVKYHGKLINN